MKTIIYILFLVSTSLNAYSFNNECINSKNFPFCLYTDSKLEFIILRNEKEVGWHKVEFEKTNEGFNVNTTAYIKAPYLLLFDYIFEYSSKSTWIDNKLINNTVEIDDDGDDYSIKIKRTSENTLAITDQDDNINTHSGNDILPSDHWHPYEVKYKYIINTLNGEILNINVKKVNDNTWYVDGEVKYYINYDSEGRWTGLKFDADEDDIIEYICTSCN